MRAHESQRREYQVIVVGAGPGGLQLGYHLGRAGVDYLVMERSSSPGSFFERFPVHRRLLSINKINTGFSDWKKNLRWDWNSLISDHELRMASFDQSYFPNADSLVAYLRAFSETAEIQLCTNCSVSRISKRDDQFIVQTNLDREFRCKILVMATGMSAPYIPNIEGVEFAESYASHDRSIERCRNKDILIIGKGNSAFETAEFFLPHAARIHLLSPNYLRWAWRSHFPGDVRQINSPFFETFPLKQQNAVLSGTVKKIERSGERYSADVTWAENGHQTKLIYDRVILCAGFRFDASIFAEDLMPELAHNNKLPALTSHWESANISGLYFGGALMQSTDYKSRPPPLSTGYVTTLVPSASY